ncbi:MAG: FAD-binding oxidoreductase [bacterium]|nr:FAD-binding oxidoreductase [bacterium]
MKKNVSPWIHQLDKERKIEVLKKDTSVDVAIVGGGIAGISTAFFILKNSNKKVVLVEATRIAHGATGHNAGQVCSYFEKPFYNLVEQFGNEMAAKGQKEIEDAWSLIDEMYTSGGLDISFSRFIGYDGFSTYTQVIDELKSLKSRKDAELSFHKMLIAKNADFINNISEEFKDYYSVVDQEEILQKLETSKNNFIALSLEQKGIINSALFCQEIAIYLLGKYKERFEIYENTKIEKVILKEDHALLDAGQAVIESKKIILCTNGFENIEIFNKSGLDIDTKFHHFINGVVARMSGYLEEMNKPPAAINYYIEEEGGFDNMEDPYFYLTRRKYEFEEGKDHNLISLGGPQHGIADREEYLFEFEYVDEVQSEIDEFVRSLYEVEPNKKIEYIFTWHGLMGYTPSGVRIIGEEPKNPILLYNLGCNGVGILPSIYGGEKISQILNGEQFPVSIFDPQ